jgi:hypothetical protein
MTSYSLTDTTGRRLRRGGGMSASTRHFVRHYLEMVAAMLLGMAVLGVPAGWLMSAVGVSSDAPTPMLLSMAVTMTLPMVAWMRFRGHSARANAEMAASMLLPTFAVIGLLGARIVEDAGVLMLGEHVAMLLSMLAAMLLRFDEYGHAHGHHAAPEAVAA